MAYETCPQCGARKHQLVACSQCGFKRTTVHLPIDRELLDTEEFPHSRPPTATPVSSNFETCPTCDTRKHLLMACPNCGFSRSGNPERCANKPLYVAKPGHQNNPHYETTHQKPIYEIEPSYDNNSRYDEQYRDYHRSHEVERSSPQPVVRWKRSKVTGRGNV